MQHLITWSVSYHQNYIYDYIYEIV